MRRFLLCEVCVDVRKIAPRTGRSFCVRTQIKNFWSFCGYAQTTSLWSFCDRTQKSPAPLLGTCVSTQINTCNFWSFCGYAQLLEPEKVTLAPMIRRSSNTGVSVSVRKKAPRLYLASAYLRKWILSADMYSYWSEKNTRYANHPILSFCDRTQKSSSPLLEFLRICTATGVRKSDARSHDTQIIQYWSFCDRTQTLRIWMKYYLNKTEFMES